MHFPIQNATEFEQNSFSAFVMFLSKFKRLSLDAVASRWNIIMLHSLATARRHRGAIPELLWAISEFIAKLAYNFKFQCTLAHSINFLRGQHSPTFYIAKRCEVHSLVIRREGLSC